MAYSISQMQILVYLMSYMCSFTLSFCQSTLAKHILGTNSLNYHLPYFVLVHVSLLFTLDVNYTHGTVLTANTRTAIIFNVLTAH